MFDNFPGANEITIKDIEDFLNGDGAVTPAAESVEDTQNEDPSATQPDDEGMVDTKPPVTETQAFARRLKEATTKARNEERESIAKDLGYENFAEMRKARENDLLLEKGLDPESVTPVIEELVTKRLENDPRLKELDGYRQERVSEWAKKELAELNQLTGGRIAKLADVPADVIELWKTKGTLKGAYLELHGESLIREMQTGIAGAQSRGSTSHLTGPSAAPTHQTNPNRRPFTQKERDIYKLFNPDVTEEQLSKMYKDK